MEKMIVSVLVASFTAFLYRWGGGGFVFLPPPFNLGFKGARRYVLPLFLAVLTGHVAPMAVLSLILHFDLDEIEARRWDDVFCYGMAQAWCFYFAGIASGILGAWWILGTYLSNIGIPIPKKNPRLMKDSLRPFIVEGFRIDWFWVELVQGALIGLIAIA